MITFHLYQETMVEGYSAPSRFAEINVLLIKYVWLIDISSNIRLPNAWDDIFNYSLK